jgi:hypothetical protein
MKSLIWLVGWNLCIDGPTSGITFESSLLLEATSALNTLVPIISFFDLSSNFEIVLSLYSYLFKFIISQAPLKNYWGPLLVYLGKKALSIIYRIVTFDRSSLYNVKFDIITLLKNRIWFCQFVTNWKDIVTYTTFHDKWH